ncbi:MAG: carboxypeptidase regulatory-like domain-containing protein [archaeon]|nr:carboxypeptidase regulatory-like domain-containing protein [archaeon]
MARQTRRKRDSKSKNRFRTRLASTPSSDRGLSGGKDSKLGIKSTKVSKVNWTTVLALVAIFIFSLYIRTAWTIEPATEDGFQLTGGSDPYYHKRVVDHVADTGEHLERDPMLNYPYGANNNRPPLFDWSIAIVGLALSPFFSSSEESVWWAMEIMPAIYGAMIIFPVYAIGKSQFGKEAGLIGAFLIGVNSGHVSHSSLGLADHDSYIILFTTTAYFFFMKALTVANDKKWISNWRDFEDVKKGFTNFVSSEKLAIGYAGLTGITITMISMSWKGFPYIMAIIAIYLGFQMLINAFRRIDSLTTAMLGFIALAMPVILSYPYYHTMGFVNTWWEAPAYILLGYTLLSLLMVTTRDLPWLLVIGSSMGIALGIYLLLTYVFTDLGFLLFSGQGYFVRTKLFNTIAEAQAPEFTDFVFAFGPVSIWLGLFGIVWMAYQLFNQSIWKKDYLFVMIWAIVSIYMAQSAVRFIFNATPVVSLLSGWVTWLIIDWANFSIVLATWKAAWGKRGGTFLGLSILSLVIGFWLFFTVSVLIGILSAIILIALIMVIGHMDAQDDDQYRFRDRISGLRKGMEMKRTLVVLFVGLFIFLPNTFYGYDAGVPFENKKDHDVDVYDFLSYDFFRPTEYNYGERANTTLYPGGVEGMYNTTNNQLWYMGNTGPSFPQDYWIEGLEWLAEQDTNLAPEERPGFMSWWDYGFWAIDIGEHPTVADNFQFGYQIAGNFIASQSEEEAMALLLYRLLEPEVDRDTDKFNSEIRTALLEYYSEENITEFENIVSNPESYIPKKSDGTDQDVHKKNAAIRAGKPILMTLEKNDISDIIWEVEEITGKSIRYFAADTRLMPYSAQNTGIMYAPVTLADYDISSFIEVQAVLSNGQTLPFDEAIEVLGNDPNLQVTDQRLVYKEKFLNSMFFRSFIGWSGPDIGRPAADGIPSISGTIGQDQSLPPLPGWNLTHFKLVQINSGLRILKYYDGATLYGTVATPDGSPIANANVTVSDEYNVPHGRATTDENGEYSVIAPAGNLTLAVSIGNYETDIERVKLVSNNILVTKDNIIVSEEQAMRQTASDIKIDLEVEASSVSGRLFWDINKDNTFDSNDETIPLTPVTATNIRSNEVKVVNTDANGNYQLLGLAPGEYEITTVINGHDVELASYTGRAALSEGQNIPAQGNQGPGALESGKIWGRIAVGNVEQQIVTISLHDETNNSATETSFVNTNYFSSTCAGETSDTSISYCFDKLLPGNYTMRFESDSMYTGWTNNTKNIELEQGSSRSFNATLLDGFRVEGTLSHNSNPISNEQISFRNLNGLFSDNVFTTESGYFATILTAGTYNVYTTHKSESTTLAYLSRIDSDTYSGPIDAAMGPGHTIEGTLFNDLDGDGKFNKETGEITYAQVPLRIESESGSVSITTTFDGKYEIVLPDGNYNAYSVVEINEGQKEASLSKFQVENGDRENVNLSTSLGHDVMIIMYEEYLDEMITLEGAVQFSSTVADIEMWVTDPSTMQVLPAEDYDVTLEKFGYSLDNMYLGPEDSKIAITQLEIPIQGGADELIIVAKRIPTAIDGTFVHDGTSIPNAVISFAPMSHPFLSLNFTTDENGAFEDVMLPPDNYMYTITLDSDGSRYYVAGQIGIPIGTPSIDMGELTAELRYLVAGDIALDGEAKTGIIQFTPVNDFGNITSIESTPFGTYSEYLFPGNYYVTFQDGQSSKHYSYGGLLELTESSDVHDIALLNEGHVRGDVRSVADNNIITDRSVRIEFTSEQGIVFIADSDADEGLFGGSLNYGKIDLPNGDYDVLVTEDGYQTFTDTLTVSGSTDYYSGIMLTPKTVNITLAVTYRNATGSMVPLSDAEVVFTGTGAAFSQNTDEDGKIIISDMVPRTYEIEIDTVLNDGEDQFKLSPQNIIVRAGKEQQEYNREANWKVQVSGTIFYDRELDGNADAGDLLGNSKVEIWNVQGDRIDTETTSDANGFYELYLSTGSYQTWFYNTEETSYVSIDNLELEEAINLDASLTRGVNYIVTYQSNETTPEDLDFANIQVNGDNFSFEFDSEDSGIVMVVPSGDYNFESEYENLDDADDYIFILDMNVNITDSLDGIGQTELIDSDLMRGIEVTLDKDNYEIPLGQTAVFTFNVTSTGSFDIVLETDTGDVPTNWTAAFEPTEISLNANDNNKPVVLSITPDESVVPGVWEIFDVKIMWSDDDDNDVDDITRSFSIRVDPIEQPEPDFTILDNDFTWSPGAPTVGDEVTLTATITNLVNHSGVHSVPVVFYADDIAINLTTAEFDGSGDEVTVTAVWTATAGMHYLKVAIDPESVISETDIENNKANAAFSIEAKEEDNDNSLLRMAALVVVGLVAGLVYVSYRSRR